MVLAFLMTVLKTTMQKLWDSVGLLKRANIRSVVIVTKLSSFIHWMPAASCSVYIKLVNTYIPRKSEGSRVFLEQYSIFGQALCCSCSCWKYSLRPSSELGYEKLTIPEWWRTSRLLIECYYVCWGLYLFILVPNYTPQMGHFVADFVWPKKLDIRNIVTMLNLKGPYSKNGRDIIFREKIQRVDEETIVISQLFGHNYSSEFQPPTNHSSQFLLSVCQFLTTMLDEPSHVTE